MAGLAHTRDEAQPRSTAGVVARRGSLRTLGMRFSWPRYVLYAVAVLAIARAVVGIATPPSPPRPVIVRPSGEDLAAAGYAALFAHAYLTYDSQNPSSREQALQPFVGGPLDQDAGFSAPTSGSQQVFSTQVVGQAPVPGGKLFTVMAATSRLGVVDLAVTVGRNSSGALELVGPPAFVGPPLSTAAVNDPSQLQPTVSDQGLVTVVSRAIGNYLAGNVSELQADLTPGAIVSPPAQTFHVQQIERVAWLTPGRVVAVDLQAQDRVGGDYELHYELSVTHRYRWYVSSIESNPTQSGDGG